MRLRSSGGKKSERVDALGELFVEAFLFSGDNWIGDSEPPQTASAGRPLA